MNNQYRSEWHQSGPIVVNHPQCDTKMGFRLGLITINILVIIVPAILYVTGIIH